MLYCFRPRFISFKWWASRISIFQRENILHCMRCLSRSFKWWTCCTVWGLFSMCLDYIHNLHLKSVVACMALSIQKLLAKNETTDLISVHQTFWRLWSPRWGVEVHCTLSLTLELDRGKWSAPHLGPLYCQGIDLVPILQKVGCASWPVWIGVENLASHLDSIPGPPSLYWVYISAHPETEK
jgi:hypothetical protein